MKIFKLYGNNFNIVPTVVGILVTLIGIFVLTGWILNLSQLKSLLSYWPSMKIGTAVGFILCGITMLILVQSSSIYKQICNALSAVIIIFGLTTIINRFIKIDFNLESFILNPKDITTTEHMPFIIAVNFAIVGIIYLITNLKTKKYTLLLNLLLFIVGVNSILSLLGYFYPLVELYEISGYPKMALHTAIAFLLLAIGIVFLNPERGVLGYFKRRKFTEESFKKILEATPDAIVMINQEGKIIFVNEQTVKLFGYEKKELIDQLVEILIPESYRNRHPQHRTNFFKEPKSRPMGIGMELFGLRKNQEVFPIEISLSPLDTNEGTVGLAAIRDITDRKKSEERFKKILEATPDAIVMINQEGKINFINEQTVKIFGYAKNELIDQFVEVLIPEPYRSRHPEHRRHFFQEPKSRPMGVGMELFGLRKNKEIFPIEISLSPFETIDGTVGLAAIRDITDRRHFEEALKEKNIELENAILAKDRFLASMSHELRTPLNAIIGFTGTLLMKLPGPLNEEQDKQLNTVKRSAKHLLSLINDLLDLAKIDSGKVELNFEITNCKELILETYSSLLPLAASKELALEIDLPDEELTIQTDKRSLTQIVINLVNNAIKFTEKGSVIIKVRREEIEEKSVLIIQIIDTGPGIKLEDQEKLFQAFQQVSKPGKRLEGTGLGLHLSQKLAHLLKGQIKLESQLDKGSTFSIELPM